MNWIAYLAAFIFSSIVGVIIGIQESSKYYGKIKRNKYGMPHIWKRWL